MTISQVVNRQNRKVYIKISEYVKDNKFGDKIFRANFEIR